MILVDANVLIDVLSVDPQWFGWSSDQLLQAAAGSGAVTNLIVFAELSPGYRSSAELSGKLASIPVRIVPLSEGAAHDAGQRFARWRRERVGADRHRVLADFLIGAHAGQLGARLLTRDARLYRRYFPELAFLTPETVA